jgi:RNA polymerase sigma-70 factor (ECF subfamily)
MIPEFAVEIIIQAQRGDEKARNMILARLRPLLKAYFVRQIGMKDEVDDLVQNTMVRVHRSLTDLQQPERFKAFAMKAALFELQDLYRGRYRIKEATYDPDEMPDSIVKPEDTGAKMDMEKLLKNLSPKAREIIELRQYGYQYDEIAGMIGSTEAAVKMQVKRSFDKLRDLLLQLTIFMLLLLKHI